MAKFTITLTENYDTKTYSISEEMFMALSFRLEPYRSYPIKSKPVRCIENGKTFNSAMQALKWLSDFGVECRFNNAEKIKRICKGKGREEKAFGFHWRFANDSDRETCKVKKKKLERWLYYASLKNEVHSKSYKITQELFKTLQKELEPFYMSNKKELAVV